MEAEAESEAALSEDDDRVPPPPPPLPVDRGAEWTGGEVDSVDEAEEADEAGEALTDDSESGSERRDKGGRQLASDSGVEALIGEEATGIGNMRRDGRRPHNGRDEGDSHQRARPKHSTQSNGEEMKRTGMTESRGYSQIHYKQHCTGDRAVLLMSERPLRT